MHDAAVVLGMAMIVALTTVSPAAADYDRPKKAVSAKIQLVRAFAPCPTPNDVHNSTAVLPACSPATPLSTYTFGPAGKGSVQVQRAAFTIKYRFELKDVRTAADQPADDVTFTGRVSFRFTDQGCSGNACTFETFTSVNLPCTAGRCFASLVYPEQFLPYVTPASAEITQVDVLDDAGNRFATAGILLE